MKNYIKDNKVIIYFDETPFVESFKILNKNTEKAQNFIKKFVNSDIFKIDQCYNKYSNRKSFIYQYWKRFANSIKGNFKILSYNCNFFTIGICAEIDEKIYFLIATAFNNYAIIL